jgi:K(+)-stimulated pyrophosphate-energized sodium pump
VATGTANRLSDGVSTAANALKPNVPDVQLKIAGDVGESRLLSFVQDTAALPSDGARFDFDRLRFNSGSATLQPEAGNQLDDVAAIFNTYPKLRARVAGYTDSRGSAQANQALSEARADTVRSQLIARGVSAGRLSAEGFSDQDAIGDNSTEAGRAQNRRVGLQVTDK